MHRSFEVLVEGFEKVAKATHEYKDRHVAEYVPQRPQRGVQVDSRVRWNRRRPRWVLLDPHRQADNLERLRFDRSGRVEVSRWKECIMPTSIVGYGFVSDRS